MRIEVLDPHNLAIGDDVERLTRIVYTIADGWHSWFGPDPEGQDLDTYFLHRPGDRELLVKSFVQTSAYPKEIEQRLVRLRVSKDAPANSGPTPNADHEIELHIEQGLLFLKQPLEVLLENSINDGKFLIRHLRVVDDTLVQLFEEPDPPVVFAHAGGKGDIANHLGDRHVRCASRGFPPRVIVIFDSDALFPGQTTKETNTVTSACDSTGTKYHVLKKRSIENYIADRDLQAYAQTEQNLRDAIGFFRKLRRDQKDYYPLKKGFPKGSEVSQQIKLFADVVANKNEHKIEKAAEYMIETSALVLSIDDLKESESLEEFLEIANLIRSEL